MDSTGIAPVISAASAAAATLLGAWFVQKRRNKSQDVSNFQILFNEVSKDVGRVRDEQREERKQWSEERKAFNADLSKLRDLIRTQDKALHAKEIEVTQLTGKVDLLQSQLDAYREFHSGNTKNVTIKT